MANMKFHLYREGEEGDVIEITGPETITASELKTLSETFRSRGYTVVVNGTPAADATVEELCASLRTKGISVFVDGAPAHDDTPIRSGSLVTSVGEVKGA